MNGESELRRYSRQVTSAPVVLETRDGCFRLPLIDLSPGGAEIRFTESLQEGTKGRLHFLPPSWRERAIEVIVWRIDLDGVVLTFTGAIITSVSRPTGRSSTGLVALDLVGPSSGRTWTSSLYGRVSSASCSRPLGGLAHEMAVTAQLIQVGWPTSRPDDSAVALAASGSGTADSTRSS